MARGNWNRPAPGTVRIDDPFWTPYLENIRTVMLPYVLDRMEESGYMQNYRAVGGMTGEKHKGPPFSDGLLLETVRGACDFLTLRRDPALEERIDGLIALFTKAAEQTGGFLCTQTTQDYPDRRFGENGGDIIIQHDLYDHGALAEAAVSHYFATGKTTLLTLAVRAANLICSQIGEPPKKNIVPGHSLPEEAFVKLYRLFRDHRELDGFAEENGVCAEDYLHMAEFWYEARGRRENRNVSPRFTAFYNQDHETFSLQRTAVGHAVRASLCYTGAAAVAYETGNEAYRASLDALWDNVYKRKLHISGGIGTRHDIEGFDEDYNLPNDAYLETCAAIGFAFWAGEMSLLDAKAEYYEGFERALYNNILASVAPDAQHYFYENPLISSGGIRRWAWHGCPCCPPMLLKLFGSLGSYIYTDREDAVNVHLLIGSTWETEGKRISVEKRSDTCFIIRPDTKGVRTDLRIRIPPYAEDVMFTDEDDTVLLYTLDHGYAVIRSGWKETAAVTMEFRIRPKRVFASPMVAADRGRVAVTYGPYLMCAEGMDNFGETDFTVAERPELQAGEEHTVKGLRADGKPFLLIPYYSWCRREGTDADRAMAVWFLQENMKDADTLSSLCGDALYGVYEEN